MSSPFKTGWKRGLFLSGTAAVHDLASPALHGHEEARPGLRFAPAGQGERGGARNCSIRSTHVRPASQSKFKSVRECTSVSSPYRIVPRAVFRDRENLGDCAIHGQPRDRMMRRQQSHRFFREAIGYWAAGFHRWNAKCEK